MSGRAAGRVAWSGCGLALVFIVCAVVLSVLNGGSQDLSFLIGEATGALVGGLVASRRPRNPVGWFIIGHVLFFAFGEFARQYAIYGILTEPGSLPIARAMASPPYWVWYPGLMLMLAFLPLYFPNGRLVSPRWRPVSWFAACVAVVATGISAIRKEDFETPGIPNPLGIESLENTRLLSDALTIAMPVSWLGIGVLSTGSLLVRFLRSGREERQQIKWFSYAIVLLILFSALDIIFRTILSPLVNSVLFTVLLMGPWAAITVAIFRYRLYDIDLIINRTLVYGSLTAALVLLYLGGVVVLQGAFRTLAGDESQLAVVASTLAIAALFSPLRRRIQGFIDRGFYRRKYDAAKTLETFSAKLRDETDLERLADEMVSVVRETMQPARVSLLLRLPHDASGVRRGSTTDE